MRILQVTIYGELKFGGVPQKIFSLSEGLAERGHQVQIVSFHSELRKGGQSELNHGVKTEYLPWTGKSLWQLPGDLRKLRKLVKKADIVHCYGLYNLLCPLTALLAVLHKKPYLLEPEGMYVRRAGNEKLKTLYHWLCTSWMARRADRIVATSETEATELYSLVNEEKVVVRRNGINVEQFKELPAKEQFRKEHGIGNDKIVVLFMGRISPIKNLEILIRAFQQLGSEKLKLVIVGPHLETNYFSHLKTLIESLQISHQVLFTGPLYEEKKLAAFSAANMFVMPSQYESFGIAAAEAVASQIPVLLTDTCGIAPLIHGRAGLAVSPDMAALTDGLRTLLDAEQCKKLVARRAEVLQELSWHEPLLLTEQIYRSIIKK